jgi:hypothetical protein
MFRGFFIDPKSGKQSLAFQFTKFMVAGVASFAITTLSDKAFDAAWERAKDKHIKITVT